MSSLQHCLGLAAQIKDRSEESIFHPDLRQLRLELRHACYDVLKADLRSAQKAGLEQLLWKHAFYQPIRGFRCRLADSNLSPDVASKTRQAFLKFLEDGVAYYSQLAELFQSLGTAQRSFQLGAEHADCEQHDGQSVLRAALSRALICEGDLERYHAAASDCHDNPAAAAAAAAACKGDEKGAAKPAAPPLAAVAPHQQFAKSWKSYARAAAVYPEAGNAWNQLAVLCTLQEDDLSAAYYYLRATYAPRPFQAARNNATQHFLHVEKASPSLLDAHKDKDKDGVAPSFVRGGGGRDRKGARSLKGAIKASTKHKPSRPAAALESDFRWASMRLLTPLFLRIDLDTTPRNFTALEPDLDEVLHRMRQQIAGGSRPAAQRRAAALAIESSAHLRPPTALTSLVASLILLTFAASSSSGASASSMASEKSAVQSAAHAAALGHATAALCNVGAKIATTASNLPLGDASPRGDAALASQLLPPLRILVRWLALSKARVLLPPRGTALPPSVTVAEEAVQGLQEARSRLWQALSAFVDALALAIAVLPSAQEGPAQVWLPEDIQFAAFPPLIDGGAVGAGGRERMRVQLGDVFEGVDALAISRERARSLWGDASEVAAVAAAWLATEERDGAAPGGLVAGMRGFVQRMEKHQNQSRSVAQPAKRKQPELAGGQQQNMQFQRGRQGHPEAAPLQATHGDEEEQEQEQEQQQQQEQEQEQEIIVFAPGRKTPPRSVAPTAAPCDGVDATEQREVERYPHPERERLQRMYASDRGLGDAEEEMEVDPLEAVFHGKNAPLHAMNLDAVPESGGVGGGKAETFFLEAGVQAPLPGPAQNAHLRQQQQHGGKDGAPWKSNVAVPRYLIPSQLPFPPVLGSTRSTGPIQSPLLSDPRVSFHPGHGAAGTAMRCHQSLQQNDVAAGQKPAEGLRAVLFGADRGSEGGGALRCGDGVGIWRT